MARSGNSILGLTVNGAGIGQTRLQTGTVTAFSAATVSAVLAPNGSAPANGTVTEGYLSDFLYDSGLINAAASPTAIMLSFSPALVNRPGPDLVVLEINPAGSADPFLLQINGVTRTVTAAEYGSTGVSTSSADVMNTRNAANTADITVSTLSQLRSAPLALSGSNDISQVVFGVAIDLSDFGVAEGASVASIQLGSTASANFDPVFVAGIIPPVEMTTGPIISEFLTDNGEGIEDEDGNKPDWLELYNGTSSPVDLTGWSLTNNAGVPKKWPLPSGLILQPFEYRMVFASSKNRTSPQLHTNFNLSKSSGFVALTRPDGSVASGYTYGAQSEDVSYGVMGASLSTGFLATPTPGYANIGNQSPNGPAADVVFSVPSGVFGAPFSLSLSLPAGTPGTAIIRYTTDLSEPLETSAAYTTPITVSNSTTVRARVFQPDHLPGAIGNRHFIRIGSNLTTDYRSTGQPFRSNLPVLVLDSFGVNVDSNTSQSAPYRTTLAAIYEPNSGTGMTSFGSAPTLVQRGGTHVRGQSSANFPQRQYAWELWREHIDEDENVSLLGMSEGADWVLHAPWNDKSLMRNALAFGLARDWAGPGAGMRTRFVEVFFNQAGTSLDYNDYRGVYVLVEKIDRDEDRIDVEELTPLSTDIIGGYIFAKDKPPADNPFTTTTTGAWGGQPLDIVEPKEPTGAQLEYLRTYMNGFESALTGPNFTDPVTGYASFIDPVSFQDWHLMAEFSRQTDAFQNSNYFHKRRGERVKALPVWDFNLAFANNSEAPDGGSAQPGQGPSEGWHWIRLFDDWLSQKGPSHYPWFPRLFQDEEFRCGYWDRYWEKRRTILSPSAITSRIDSLAAQLMGGLTVPVTNGTGNWPASIPSVESPAGRHFARWQILGDYVWTTPIGWADRTTYAHEVGLLRNWVVGRLEWMDSQSLASTPTTSSPSVASVLARPPEISGAGAALINPNVQQGEMLYTIDGPDPRIGGGAVHASARTAGAGRVEATELIPLGASWKFLAPTSAPSSLWKDQGFDDSSWAQVSGMNEQAQSGTTYFRKTFQVTGANGFQSVLFDLQVDDGAVVWLNGVELRRVGMPFAPTPIAHATAATGLIDKAHEREWITWLSPAGVIQEGNNTLAIEVHQYAYDNGVPSAVDLSFDLRVRALRRVEGTPLAFASAGNHVVRARVKSGATWSPLLVQSVTATAIAPVRANLAVTELMYCPRPSGPSEAPFSAADFEFIELTNIGQETIDLSGMIIAGSVTFAFADAAPGSRTLVPGGRVVVVSNEAAFPLRYPSSSAIIAGAFTGNLDDASAQVRVLDGTGGVIREFTYVSAEPWPVDAGAGGVSLVLNAAADLDHTLPENWHAGATEDGVPGADDHQPSPANPNGDDNGDGLSNLYEYATGGSSLPSFTLEAYAASAGPPETHAMFRFNRNLAAGGRTFIAEACDNLASWDASGLVYVGTSRRSDGTAVVTYRSAVSFAQLSTKFFARLRVK